jgi:hypothetical protein
MALGKNLMRQAVGADGKITGIVTGRDGLMIGLLAVRPVRRRTFSLMRRSHLRRVGDEWRMIFAGRRVVVERDALFVHKSGFSAKPDTR